MVRAAEYRFYWDVLMLLSIIFVKTSVAVAILRIAASRFHTYAVYACLAISDSMFFASLVCMLTVCTPIAASWNPLFGSCNQQGLLPILYLANVIALFTDAGCAIIPIFIVRNLSMPRRTRYALMAVLAMGGLTVVIALGRFGVIHYMYYDSTVKDYSCELSTPPFERASLCLKYMEH